MTLVFRGAAPAVTVVGRFGGLRADSAFQTGTSGLLHLGGGLKARFSSLRSVLRLLPRPGKPPRLVVGAALHRVAQSVMGDIDLP
ncbi:MAG TPA: hypothetical protein VM265_02540, partial [Sphingomicrobium sp.]|nr:hypothetical protein [Sphingomicrobium sp.]